MGRRYLLVTVILCCGCGLPRDPEHTLDRVQEWHRIRVGLSENPPWVVRTSGEPGGVEVELIRQFAHELGATPDWTWGSEQQLMQALKQFRLDLVAAGIEKSTPWSKTIGLTRPYYEGGHVLGVPPGENGWLKRLQEFLFQHESEVKGLLAR